MLSVVIPTLDAERGLVSTLSALVPATVEGVVREVIISDGGSADGTETIADAAGCHFVRGPAGRGGQLARGAARARERWLLFLHADTILETDWFREVGGFIARLEAGGRTDRAAVFRFALDEPGLKARVLESIVALRVGLLALPYGDQGLLISRSLYDELGGFSDMPLMEDVDLVRRLGRRRLTVLPRKAVTSAERYRRDGFAVRVARNALCLALYRLGVSPERLVRLYG